MALAYAFPIKIIMIIVTPISIIINALARVIMFVLRIDPNAKTDTLTEDELRTLVDVSHEDGVIESEEREMIYNVFEFGDAVAKDIMIPRIDMVTASIDCTYTDLIAIFKKSM